MADISKHRARSLAAGILLLAAALRLWAFAPYDTVHADEFMQYLEQAHRLASGYGLVPWESRYGIRSPLIPDLLAGPMALGAAIAPGSAAPLMAARLIFALLCLAVVPAAYAIGRATSRVHGLVAMLVAAVWYESVLFGVHVLSESLATAAALGGSAALLHVERRYWGLAAGSLLALAVLLRAPYAAYVGPLILLSAGRDLRLWRHLALGALPALALSALADIAAGLTPFSWIWRSYALNMGGRAAAFGVHPPLQYLEHLWVRLFPAGLAILIGACLAPARYRPMLAGALLNIAAHSLIPHKEYRFIWLSVLVLVILAAITSVGLVDRLLAARKAYPHARSGAIGALSAMWCALSGATLLFTGGTDSFRGGRQITLAVVEAGRRPQTCGIALASSDRRHAATFLLAHPAELYLLPDGMIRGTEPVPPAVTQAANALILTGSARPPAGYRPRGCRDAQGQTACLFVREGGCHPGEAARGMTYQAVMLKDDV